MTKVARERLLPIAVGLAVYFLVGTLPLAVYRAPTPMPRPVPPALAEAMALKALLQLALSVAAGGFVAGLCAPRHAALLNGVCVGLVPPLFSLLRLMVGHEVFFRQQHALNYVFVVISNGVAWGLQVAVCVLGAWLGRLARGALAVRPPDGLEPRGAPPDDTGAPAAPGAQQG